MDAKKEDIYTGIEYKTLKLRRPNQDGKTFVKLFVENCVKEEKKRDLSTKIVLNKLGKRIRSVTEETKDEFDKKKVRAGGLKSEEKKKLRLFELEPQHHNYELYGPLRKLWTEYMRSLLNLKSGSSAGTGINMQNVYHKLVSADYYGCVITVTKCKCPSRIGLTGVVVRETKFTFSLITKGNELKTIPKAGSVFNFVLNGYVFTIYGNHFTQRPADRIVKKFKSKPTVEL